MRVGGDDYAVMSVEVRPGKLPASLTDAERAVAVLVLGGCSNTEIARRRGTSARTVANQLASIFRKVGVSSRAELACACAGTEDGHEVS